MLSGNKAPWNVAAGGEIRDTKRPAAITSTSEMPPGRALNYVNCEFGGFNAS
jgi:hypothetical protein